MTLKHCNGCDEDKKLSEFNFHKTGLDAGKPLSRCRICDNKARSTWRKGNLAKSRATVRKSKYRHGVKPASENKSCSAYLGCVIAETVLSHEFPGFVRMPYGYPGYDYDCPKGFKIDVKSRCRDHQKNKNDVWAFAIRKNKVPHFFLCIAWTDRESLVPEHLWLIPGYLVNDKMTFSITDSPKSLIKWSEYERSLKNVLECCNRLVSNETLWDRYQETQEFGDLTRYLKHAAYLRIVDGLKK
jgi:hypothetical protein